MSGEVRPIVRLALPLAIGQVGQMLLAVVDTVMVGQVGVLELAALSFANAVFYVPFVFGIGLLTCISVRTANARGAGDPQAARMTCRHGIYLSLVVGVVLFLASLWLANHLEIFGQPADVTSQTPTFYRILMLSMIPALVSIALKNHSDAMNRPWPAFWIFLGGVGLNAFLNWLLIFGNLGFPTLGLEGAAWGTLISRIAIVVAMLIWFKKSPTLRDWVPHRWVVAPVRAEIRKLVRLGWPASLQMLCEVTAFSAAALFIGQFGKVALASHQIALTCAGTAFMVPLGLSMALSVHIGEALGAGATHRMRSIVLSGWSLAAGFAMVTAFVFLVFGKALASLFVADPQVVAATAALLVIVGVFQLVDGLQVAAAAMLRGIHDVRLPALMAFFSYWVVGIPLGYFLSHGPIPGPNGVWWGLAIGLAVATVTLCPRLWQLIRNLSDTNHLKNN